MKPGNDASALQVKIGLVLAGLVLFGSSFSHPFHFDDALISGDSNVTNPERWQHFLDPFQLRQLTYFSFYLNHLVGGGHAVGYHVVNVALHITNAVLLFILLRRILEYRIAVVAAAIFLVHPIQTEPVFYVYQRSILLACCFSLLALLAFLKRKHWLSLILFICAFESKETSLAVPLLLAAISLYFPAGKMAFMAGESSKDSAPSGIPAAESSSSKDRPLGRVSPLFCFGLFVVVIVLGIAALELLAHRNETTVGIGAISRVSPITYFLTETRVFYTYLRLLVFPYPLSLEYDFALVRTMSFQVVAQILGVAAIVACGFFLARSESWKITGLAILAFVVLLAPTSSVIPSLDVAFEHRLYLPMLAFCVFAATLIARLKHPAWFVVPLLAVLSIVTIQRSSMWASDSTLWQETTRQVPNKARAWFNLGGTILNSDPEKAQSALKRAIELQPVFPEAVYDLGVIEQGKGNNRSAYGFFQTVVHQNPDYWPAWNNLGNVLFALGENDQAVAALEQTLRLNPDYWPAQYNIAIVQFASGRFDKALPRLRTVLNWRPDFNDARYLLAECLSKTGQSADAESERERLGQTAGHPALPATIPAPTP